MVQSTSSVLSSAGRRRLAGWTGGELATWGGDAAPGLQRCFSANHIYANPSISTFIGADLYSPPLVPRSNIVYGTPSQPLFGTGNQLLTLGTADKVFQCRASSRADTSLYRSADDAPVAAALASMLVMTPGVLIDALTENSDGTITFCAQILGDISKAPVRQCVKLSNALPLEPTGQIVSYGSLIGTLPAFFRKLRLSIKGCRNSDIYCTSAADTLSLFTGYARFTTLAVAGGASSALMAAYGPDYSAGGQKPPVAGTIRFTGTHAPSYTQTTFATNGDGSLSIYTPAGYNGRLDLVVRTDAPYAILGAVFSGRNQYVTLGNVMATTQATSLGSGYDGPYTSTLDTLMFTVPMDIIDNLEVKLAIAPAP